MKSILTFLAVVLFALPGHARLGETFKELKRRYGKPIEAEDTKEVRTARFSFYWQQYLIVVVFQDGTSVSEEYTRQNGRDFLLPEVQLLLAESSPGLPWTKVDGSTWKQRDRVATWTGRSLLVEEKARAK